MLDRCGRIYRLLFWLSDMVSKTKRQQLFTSVNRKNGANFYSENFALEMCIIHNTFYASQDEFSFEVVFYLIL